MHPTIVHPLLPAVKSGSINVVADVISNHGMPIDSRYIDYLALNKAIFDEHEDIVIFLLDHNCRVKSCNVDTVPHETPLHSAVKRRNLNIVVKLLEKGAAVDCLNDRGYSPLHVALVLKLEEIIDVMLDHIVRTQNYNNKKSTNGLTHFHVACTRKNADVIDGFIRSGIDIYEAVDNDSDYRPGFTAKHFAAEFQSLEAVRLLTKEDRKNSLPIDKNGNSAKDLAQKSLDELSIMVHLLSGEDQPKSKSFGAGMKMTQFHVACTQDNPSLVKKFIENGADVNNIVTEISTFCPGYSPLHCAVESHCKENVELLLKENADVEHQDANFATPIHLAMYNENPKLKNGIVDLLYNTLSKESKLFNMMDVYGLNYFLVAVSRNELDIVKSYLMDQGEDIEHEVLYNYRQFAHYRPLHFAVRYEHLEMTRYLIQNGSNVNAVSKDGPPLHIAIENGNADIIDFLLENIADVDYVRRIDGKTILHSLIETYINNCYKIQRDGDEFDELNDRLWQCIEPIVSLGCDINHRDDNGNTALHIACKKISHGVLCIRLLLNFGADINIINNDGDTPFDCAFHDSYKRNSNSYMMLYHHVQRLKLLGFAMNPKNDDCCQKILDEYEKCDPNANCFRISELSEKKKRRRDEITLLKQTKIAKYMSLYGFLRLNKTDAAKFVNTDALKNIIKNEETIDEKYPIYGYLIRLQFQRGIRFLVNAQIIGCEDDILADSSHDSSPPRAKRRRDE